MEMMGSACGLKIIEKLKQKIIQMKWELKGELKWMNDFE